MGEFKSFLYTDTGTEITFMQGLIDLICGLDSNITCVDANGDPTTAAAQIDGVSGHYATFIFKFGNVAKLGFTRYRHNPEDVSAYDVFPYYPTQNPDVVLRFSYNTSYYLTETTRSFLVSYYKSNDVVLLWLGSYNTAGIANSQCSVVLIKTTNDCFAGAINGTNPLAGSLLGNDSSAVYRPFFQYSETAGHIDFIEKSVFASGGTKVIEMQSIKSCSIVPQFSSIALPNGKNYFAISTNAMVEITPEEEEQEATTEGQWDSVPSMQ